MDRKEDSSYRKAGAASTRESLRKIDNPRLVARRISCQEEDHSQLESRGYVLGSTLGEGTYGKVRLATSKHKNDKRVAVKIINQRKAPEDFKNKFLPREIEILRRIHHPNIIELHDAFTVGKKVYFVMELAGHGDLLEYVKLRGKLSEQRSKSFFADIVSAISYLHALGIIHRDLKCENLLLDGGNNIKLTDFGFARRMEPGDISRTYCGSAAYAAPEILRGVAYYGTKSDIWSMGVILYIMVTGLMPYDDTNIGKLIRQQKKKLSFPKTGSTLSYNVRKLLCSLLTFEVSTRINMAQIITSDWMVQPTTQNVHANIATDLPRTVERTPSIISQILGKVREKWTKNEKTKTDQGCVGTNAEENK